MSSDSPGKTTHDWSKTTIYDHFRLFREYANHEDKLINNRLLWNINIQGFLFVTYGYSVQKLTEVLTSPNLKTTTASALYFLVGMLPVFGILISFTSYKGVQAAQIAIRNLNEQWEEIVSTYYREEDLMVPRVPELIGGGCPAVNKSGVGPPQAHDWGTKAPRRFLIIFGVAWSLLLVSYAIFIILHFSRY